MDHPEIRRAMTTGGLPCKLWKGLVRAAVVVTYAFDDDSSVLSEYEAKDYVERDLRSRFEDVEYEIDEIEAV